MHLNMLRKRNPQPWARPSHEEKTMTNNRLMISVACATMTVLALSSTALGQNYGQEPVMQPQGGYVQPVQQQPIQQQQQPVMQQQQQQPVQTARQGRGLEYGAHLLVPIFLSNPVADITDTVTGTRVGGADAGFGLGGQFRVGWEFGSGLTVELNLGGAFNGMTGELADSGIAVELDSNLLMGWFGAGVRYAFINPSALVPFVGGGISVYAVDFCSTETSACSSDATGFNATFSANVLAGIIYEISPFVGLEAGVQGTVVFSNDVFVETELLLSPFVGVTLYY